MARGKKTDVVDDVLSEDEAPVYENTTGRRLPGLYLDDIEREAAQARAARLENNVDTVEDIDE